MLVHQMAAPNSPQWFNTGLQLGLRHQRSGPGALPTSTPPPVRWSDRPTPTAVPTPHACFIQSVNDDLVDEGGIFDLVTREARVFKYGSGTGTNFSMIRGRGRAALRRRHVVGLDELPQDLRPRGRRHQERRHDATRRQDGGARHRPSRHREVHQSGRPKRSRRSPR